MLQYAARCVVAIAVANAAGIATMISQSERQSKGEPFLSGRGKPVATSHPAAGSQSGGICIE
jgi:hypothetical protein